MRASMMGFCGVVLFSGLLIAAPATQPAAKPTDVPVKVVVLFSSGVGYFEHIGTVKGDSSTELRFKTQQINDILKSLVLQDTGRGKVSTIVYPSAFNVGAIIGTAFWGRLSEGKLGRRGAVRLPLGNPQRKQRRSREHPGAALNFQRF